MISTAGGLYPAPLGEQIIRHFLELEDQGADGIRVESAELWVRESPCDAVIDPVAPMI